MILLIEFINDQLIKEGDAVVVYYNFRKKCYSIVNKKTGRVCGYSNQFMIKDVISKVYEKRRQLVLRDKRKNVHAFLIGSYIENEIELNVDKMKKLYYNPYKTSSFINYENGEHFNSSSLVFLTKDFIYYN